MIIGLIMNTVNFISERRKAGVSSEILDNEEFVSHADINRINIYDVVLRK